MLSLQHIDSRVLDYFAPWMEINPAGIPVFKDTAGTAEPHMARQHFLFHTTIDALCFCYFHPDLLNRPGTNVFTVLGLWPTAGQLLALKNSYPNARTFGVFDDDLCGRVLDCKIALWLMHKDMDFRLENQEVIFFHRGNPICIPAQSFSLHRFRIITGLRSTYRTFKPKGAVSFTAMLSQHAQDKH